MSWEENKEYTESNVIVEKKKMKAWEKNLIAGAICFSLGMTGPFVFFMSSRSNTIKTNRETISTLKEENRSLKKQLENQSGNNKTVSVNTTKSTPTPKATAPATKDAAPVTQASAANEDSSYEHNEFYDLVESSTFKDSIGYNTVVHKVLAKQDVSVSATLLAYGTDGNVIGKSSDDIILTKGEYNFFRYSIENDISSATIHLKAQAEEDSFMVGARKAVEMVQYNQNGKDLYITFKQNVDKLGTFAKFKLLFYKDDKIVNTEDGYFNIYAKNMIGKGDTDVAEIWVYGTDFDRFEYIYEP